MTRIRIMVLVVISFFTFANEAEAAEITCAIPWYSPGLRPCISLFSLRAKETLTVEVLEVKDSDGVNKSECPEIGLVDGRTGTYITQVAVCKGQKKHFTYKNTGNTEIILKININTSWSLSRWVKLRYKVI